MSSRRPLSITLLSLPDDILCYIHDGCGVDSVFYYSRKTANFNFLFEICYRRSQKNPLLVNEFSESQNSKSKLKITPNQSQDLGR